MFTARGKKKKRQAYRHRHPSRSEIDALVAPTKPSLLLPLDHDYTATTLRMTETVITISFMSEGQFSKVCPQTCSTRKWQNLQESVTVLSLPANLQAQSQTFAL